MKFEILYDNIKNKYKIEIYDTIILIKISFSKFCCVMTVKIVILK